MQRRDDPKKDSDSGTGSTADGIARNFDAAANADSAPPPAEDEARRQLSLTDFAQRSVTALGQIGNAARRRIGTRLAGLRRPGEAGDPPASTAAPEPLAAVQAEPPPDPPPEPIAPIDFRGVPLREADDTLERFRLLPDAPLTVEDAVRQAADLRLINERLRARYYRDRLIVIACLEKSGSSTLEICLREMLRVNRRVAHDIGIQKSLHAGPFAFVDALYPEILLYVRDGGVLRSYLAPSPTNLTLLEAFRCKYVVLTRHPADRLVARYCQLPGLAFGGRSRIDPGYLIENVFEHGLSMEKELDEMISGGYLLDNLTWMANWLHHRNARTSIPVRYEDLVTPDGDLFETLNKFLFGTRLKRALEKTLRSYLANYRDMYQSESVVGRRYPKGYSGKVGVAADYFSRRNIARYNAVVDTFLAAHPHGKLVKLLYPDLRMPQPHSPQKRRQRRRAR